MRLVILLLLSLCYVCSNVCAAPAPPRHTGYDDVIQLCYNALEAHLCEGTKWGLPFRFYRPSLQKYSPDQWLWDSGAHMIVWSHRNATNAVLDMRTMLQMQQPDGFVPEEIFWGPRTQQEDDKIRIQYSNSKFSDITQMPVLPFSLRAIFAASGDASVVQEFLPKLVRYFQWWRNTRDSGDGLVSIIHNWESGLDASPAYDEMFHVNVTRVDKRSFWEMYPKFVELAISYNLQYHWDTKQILDRKRCSPCRPIDRWFNVKDVGVNSVYAAGWSVLQQLALAVNDTATASLCAVEAATSARAILSKMFVPALNGFRSLYIDWDGEEKISTPNVIQNLFPLLLPSLPQDLIANLVDEVRSSSKFNSTFALPTVALDDPKFCPTFDADLMWRGPVWGFTNWFVMEGLQTHGYDEEVEEILDKWVALVRLSGIWEHYNPISGQPYGAKDVGMSTLVCDWIQRKRTVQ